MTVFSLNFTPSGDYLTAASCADGTSSRFMSSSTTYDPSTPMRCITIKKQRSDIDKVIDMSETFAPPELEPDDGRMIVRTLAVGLAPGDVRVLRGHLSFQTPPSFPYIPGGDFCGQVVRLHPNETKFKVGDVVMVLFEDAPRNALAEFVKVKTSLAILKPSNISPVQAAALPSSAMSAMTAAERYVKKGDRVLVLGGSGGVGSHLVQAAKSIGGASYVAATSTQGDMLRGLGADRVVDYRSEKWWEVSEFRGRQGRFDVIFDLWGYPDAWQRARARDSVLKTEGCFVTTVGDDPYPQAHSKLSMLWFFSKFVFRYLWTKYMPWLPQYIYHIGLSTNPDLLERLKDAVEGVKIKPVLDPASPFSFDTEGVIAAFRLQESRHAHGKVVILVAEEDLPSMEKTR